MTKEQFLEASKYYFIGAFSLIDEDLSDGAFLQMHLDSAQCHLTLHKDYLKPPKNIDAEDIVSYYFEHGEKCND